MAGLVSEEGEIDFVYQGEKLRTFYKTFGDVRDRSKRTLVVLHGGPGLVHDYLIAHSDLTSKYDIPIILYDQVGNGRSTHLKEKAPEFFSFELFIAELENVIEYFGIQDGFDLLGHSWGGILACEFEARKQPVGLRRLILANTLAAYNLWIESNLRLLKAFPDEVTHGFIVGMKDPGRFYEALKKLQPVHSCTAKPMPVEFVRTFEYIFGPDGDPTVAAAPILDGWTIIDRLHLFHIPTFLINGRQDMTQDFAVKPLFDNIQQVKWVTLEQSSHTPFLEERDRYMQIVADFLAL